MVLTLCMAVAPSVVAAVPSNDDFSNAQALNGALPIEATATNVGATAQAGEPGHPPLSAGGHTVWFRWEAMSTEAVTISTCGSEMPTIIGVYLGSSLEALTEVAGNTWDWPGCSFQEGSQATFRAIAGKVYSIQIDGNVFHEGSQPPVSGEGSIKLEIRHREPPANDDFDDAKPIDMDGLSTPAPNFGATKQAGEPNHRADQGGASVWFKFTAPRSGGASIHLNGEPMGHEGLVAVYTGSSVDNLTAVPAFETRWTSELYFPVTAGVTYRIAVDGQYSSSTESPFMDEPELSLYAYPGNDDFEDAYPLPSAPMGNVGVNGLGNTGATKQAGEPDHAGNRGGVSVWFTWKAFETGSAQINACGATFDTLLAVYTGSTVGGLTPVAASRNPQSPANAPQAVQPQLLGSHRPPRTKIGRRHVSSRRRSAVFHLRSSEVGSHFLCKLDSRSFRRCSSSLNYRGLKPGRHVFAAKAVNSWGEVDLTPSVFRFRIEREIHG